MARFKVGDKIVLPSDKIIVPREFSGRSGTITEVFADMPVHSDPGQRLAPTYMVKVEREDDAMLVGEDWLELA